MYVLLATGNDSSDDSAKSAQFKRRGSLSFNLGNTLIPRLLLCASYVFKQK